MTEYRLGPDVERRGEYTDAMSEGKRRGSYAVGRARREAILESAAKGFLERGYSRTPMAEIAREVGLTEGGLLHYFPTKRHLLAAVAERRYSVEGRDLGVDSIPPDVPSGLRRLLGRIETFAAEPGMIEIFVETIADVGNPAAPARSMYAFRYRDVIDRLSDDLRLDRERGLIRADADVEVVARQCVAMLDGLQIQWLVADGDLDLIALVRDYLEQLSATLHPEGRRAVFA